LIFWRKSKTRAEKPVTLIDSIYRVFSFALVGAAFWATVLVSVLIWAFHSPAFLSFSLSSGLSIYNDMIPGYIKATHQSGSLSEGFVLSDVTLLDKNKETIVSVKKLSTQWSPILLIDRQIQINTLKLYDGKVRLFNRNGKSAFTDLAPLSDDSAEEYEAEEADAKDGVLPDLPLTIWLNWLGLDNIDLYQSGDNGDVPIVLGVNLAIAGAWSGQKARVVLWKLSGELPSAKLCVESAGLQAVMEKSKINLAWFRSMTNYGEVFLLPSNIDLDDMSYNVELAAEIDKDKLVELTKAVFRENVYVNLNIDGNLQDTVAIANIALSDAQLGIESFISITPEMSIVSELTFKNLRPQDYDLPAMGHFDGRGKAELHGYKLEDMQARINFACTDCSLMPFGLFSLTVDGLLDKQQGEAFAKLSVSGIEAEIATSTTDMETFNADYELESENLSAIASAFDIKGIEGVFSLSGACSGAIADPDCNAAGYISEFSFTPQKIAFNDLKFSVKAFKLATERSFASQIIARKLTYDVYNLEILDLSARGDPAEIEATLELYLDEKNVAKLDFHLQPGPPLFISLNKCEGLLKNKKMKLLGEAGLRLSRQTVKLDNFSMDIEHSYIKAHGYLALNGASNFSMKIEKLDVAIAKAFVDMPDVSTDLDFDLHLSGHAKAPRIATTLKVREASFEGQSFGQMKFGANWSDQLLKAKASQTLNEESIDIDAKIPISLNIENRKVEWKKDADHVFNFKVEGFEPQHLPKLAGVPRDLNFLVNLSGRVKGALNNIDLQTEMNGDVGYGKMGKKAFSVNLASMNNRQNLSMVLGAKDKPLLSVEAQANLDFEALMQVERKKKLALDTQMVVDLKSNRFDLALLNAIFPSAISNVKGHASMDIKIEGLAGDPKPNGFLKLEGGRMTVKDIYQTFEDITLVASIDERTISIDYAGLRVGKGELSASGAFTLAPEYNLDGIIGLEFVKFPLQAPGIPPNRLDSNIVLKMAINSSRASIGADVKATTFTILDVTPRTSKEIPYNKNITYLGERETKNHTDDVKSLYDLDFDVKTSEPVVVSGPQIDMTWLGNIKGLTIKEGLAVTGDMTMNRGRFEFLGNVFLVEQSTLVFPPGATNEPYIALSAVTTVSDASVTITIKGPVSRPELTFSSEPNMEQYQIFTLLVTGATETSEESQQQVQGKAANMGAGYIAFKYPELQRQLSDRLGIDRVSLSFGETTEEPIVSVGKRINRHIMAETSYHHNAPEDVNRAELKAYFNITPNWDLETYYGDASVGGLDLFWHTSFGNKPPEVIKNDVKEKE